MSAETISIISIIIAGFAAFMAWKVYSLSIRQPYENRIFEEKLKSYKRIINIMNNALNVIIDSILTVKDEKLTDKQLDKLDAEIFNSLYDLDDAIASNSLVLPIEISNKLQELRDFLDVGDYLEGNYFKPNIFNPLNSKMNEYFDDIVDSMRNDLNFEKLDHSLRTRIRSNKIRNLIDIP